MNAWLHLHHNRRCTNKSMVFISLYMCIDWVPAEAIPRSDMHTCVCIWLCQQVPCTSWANESVTLWVDRTIGGPLAQGSLPVWATLGTSPPKFGGIWLEQDGSLLLHGHKGAGHSSQSSKAWLHAEIHMQPLVLLGHWTSPPVWLLGASLCQARPGSGK